MKIYSHELMEVNKIRDRLLQVEIGDLIAHTELSALIGKDTQNDRRAAGVKYKAMRIVQREYGYCFEIVIKEGYRRMAPKDVATTTGPKLARKVHRLAHRGKNRLIDGVPAAAYKELTNEERSTLHASLSLMGVLADIATEKTIKIIEDRISDENKTLSFRETLALFAKK